MMARFVLSLSSVFCIFVYFFKTSDATITYRGRKYVGEGDSFSITCTRTAFGPMKWTKDSTAVIPNSENNITLEVDEIDVNSIVMKLTANSAAWDHRGKYKCDPLDQSFHTIEVIPSKETDFENTNIAILLNKNETLELYCPDTITDKNVTEITWYKDGHKVSNIDDPRFSVNNRTLLLEGTTENDTGVYLCVIEVVTEGLLTYPQIDYIGYATQVTYPAYIEDFPPQLRPILGRNFSIECKVHGFPVPRVTWFIDNIPFDEVNTTRYFILDNVEGLPNAVFFIEDVTYDDVLLLTCTAENMQGTEDTSVFLAVRENAISTNEEYPGAGIQLIPGSNLVLQCNTTDDYNLNVKWYKNGSPLNTTDSRFAIENSNNSLIVTQTTENDTGIYTCVVDSKTSMIPYNASIEVRTKVRLLPFDSSGNVVQGQNIVLLCSVTQGVPLPTLKWFKDGLSINLTDPRITVFADDKGIQNSKVVITNSDYEDRGEYMCVASNPQTSANTTILIRIKDKYAALWPFIGICVEVAILCTIIFVYEKRRQKPEFDESEADQATENKTVADQEEKSQEVRQRK